MSKLYITNSKKLCHFQRASRHTVIHFKEDVFDYRVQPSFVGTILGSRIGDVVKKRVFIECNLNRNVPTSM